MKMFIDRKDSARKDNGIRGNDIEKSLKNHNQLALPMSAFGETICKVMDKCGEDSESVLLEMHRLMKKNVVIPCYIKSEYASDVFTIAKNLSIIKCDDRDRISPMDALIAASATVDQRCTTFYTMDSTLLSVSEASEIIDGYRDEKDYSHLDICHIDTILRIR